MGLGLSEFLTHGESGGRQKFLKNWKDEGSIVVWLHTRASIAYPRWSHPFIEYGTFKHKETGEEIPTLRFPRFVSQDSEVVHQSQYFRDESDRLQIPPILDPFLKLREWLRTECTHPYETVVFRWVHPNPAPGRSAVIEWKRGNLARLVEKNQVTYSHTLDTKLEYFFVVVNDAEPGEGAQIVQVSKLLGSKMQEELKQQMKSNGVEEGNPLVRPYAFIWEYNKTATPMKTYTAYRYNQAMMTPEIREAITSGDFPDPTPNTKPRAGDKLRIRAAMEAAAQIDLPWDLLFPDSWVDEEQSSEVNQQPTQQPTQSISSSAQPRRRRKRTVEMIPCDDCRKSIPINATKCEFCGAEYEIDVDTTGNVSELSTPNSASQQTVSDTFRNTPQSTSTYVHMNDDIKLSENEKCWSCGGSVQGTTCSNCGLDISDDVPF